MSRNLVIVPTYNERENIEKLVRTVFELSTPFDILIVDDNSPDGTQDIVRRLIEEFGERLHMETRPGKMGLGTAYIFGFKWALKKGYDFIFEMDADFSHNPKDLEPLLFACRDQGGDMSIGSRYTSGGKVENWPVGRILMSYFASVYVRLVLWMNVKDTTAGFKCYSRKVLETLNLDEIRSIGYAFQIEMKYRAWKRGFKIIEVPITFIDRQLGVSKMSSKIFGEALISVIRMRFLRK